MQLLQTRGATRREMVYAGDVLWSYHKAADRLQS
jgi:hypothetical protein